MPWLTSPYEAGRRARVLRGEPPRRSRRRTPEQADEPRPGAHAARLPPAGRRPREMPPARAQAACARRADVARRHTPGGGARARGRTAVAPFALDAFPTRFSASRQAAGEREDGPEGERTSAKWSRCSTAALVSTSESASAPLSRASSAGSAKRARAASRARSTRARPRVRAGASVRRVDEAPRSGHAAGVRAAPPSRVRKRARRGTRARGSLGRHGDTARAELREQGRAARNARRRLGRHGDTARAGAAGEAGGRGTQ